MESMKRARSVARLKSRSNNQIALNWMPVGLPKHLDTTVPGLIKDDLSYFYWGLSKGAFTGVVGYQAENVEQKLRHVKPPRKRSQDWRFAIRFREDAFRDFQIIKLTDLARYEKRSDTIISKHLDFSIVSRLGWSTNKARQKFVDRFLEEFFPGRDEVSHKSLESFCERDSNFDLDCREHHCPKINRWNDATSQ